MARTPEGFQLTEAHRLLQGRVTAVALRDLLHLWGTVDPIALGGTLPPFTRAALAVVLNSRRASATAASRYYMAFRTMEGVQGSVAIATAAPPPDAVIIGNLRGAGLAGIKNGRARGMAAEAAHQNGFVKLAGSAAQLVAGGGRETLLGAIQSDPAAQGWQRVTDGSPCAFCAMIAGRGIIGKDEGVGFEAHGHCGCTAEPAFDGTNLNPANAKYQSAWGEATGGLSGPDALNAFRRHLAAG